MLNVVYIILLVKVGGEKKQFHSIIMAQQQYSVGGRVRVSLGGAVYTAAVIKVHVGDANDAVFAKAVNVGVSLTAANHILELELMGEVVQVRVYLNRCSRVTCKVATFVCR